MPTRRYSAFISYRHADKELDRSDRIIASEPNADDPASSLRYA